MTSDRSDASGALTAVRPRADYNDAEREFSRLLRTRVAEVLEGKRNRLQILRKYPGDPTRVGVLVPFSAKAVHGIRAPVAERLTWDAIQFIQADHGGGPIVQTPEDNGDVLEIQSFPTKYPHIVIERIDRFRTGSDVPEDITWTLQRVQNQRAQTQVNRLLDATNLLFELVRLVR